MNNSNTTTINNSGTIGVANTGEISHVRNIEANIGRLNDNNANDVAEAFLRIKNSIQSSTLVPSEEERKELLEALDGLSENAALPAEKRPSLLKSSVRGFAAACKAVGDISDAWTSVEGPIKNFFGLQ